MVSNVVVMSNHFEALINEQLTKCDIGENEKNILREKFVSVFKDNIKLGLASLAVKSEPGQPQPTVQTEVTLEDVQGKEDALNALASRRKRYPARITGLLQKTYKKNRESLIELNVNISKDEKEELGWPGSSEKIERLYDAGIKKLKHNQQVGEQQKEAAASLVAAFKILKNAEEANNILCNK